MPTPDVLADRPRVDPADPGATPPPAAPPAHNGAPARPPRAPRAPRAADWKVSEAPASCCLKWRIGPMELMYTVRGTTEAELQPRIAALLPWLQALVSEVEAHAVPPHGAPATDQGPPAPPDVSAPPATPREAWCTVHQARMGRHSNANGTWYSHRLPDGTYCKGT
jgi:hypothetical protein